jgi:hypothetical protein
LEKSDEVEREWQEEKYPVPGVHME